MIAGARGSWQTVVADLALILFMVTAAMMDRKDEGEHANPLPARGEPLAIYRADETAPPFDDWMASQPRDPRQVLTVVARYADEDVETAAKSALDLASQADFRGRQARIILEPSDYSETLAVLAFDKATNWHADCKPADAKDAPRPIGKDDTCD